MLELKFSMLTINILSINVSTSSPVNTERLKVGNVELNRLFVVMIVKS